MEGTVAHETPTSGSATRSRRRTGRSCGCPKGFATYFGNLFFEHADGEAEFRRSMQEDRQDYLSSAVTGQAVIDSDQQNLFELLNANNYPKGGWVLHMLRGILGDDAFFDGIRSYYRRYAGRNASTEDFRRVMEET